ncbi:MAG: hypothetical protein KY391_00455 [Actinobacteria bacterium]|nr:hypothetical protein [Actinomycetota bacterium]
MNEERGIVEPKRRSVVSKLLELLFWAAIAVITAWVLIENIERILPANNF